MPGEERVDDVAELGYLAGAVDVREPVERFEGAFSVLGEVEAVQLAERCPCSLEPRVGGEEAVEACSLGGVERVGAAHEQEPCPEHFGVGRRGGALGAALDVAAHRGQPRCEPSDDPVPVQHVAGAAEPPFDCCLVRLRAVGHHDLHALAPSVPLGGQEPRQRLGVAVGHHREHLAGVAVHEHRHVPVPTADRGPLHQKQPASSPPPAVRDQPRIDDHQRIDQTPAQPAAAGRRVDRHRPRVLDHTTGQPGRETALERRAVLAEPTAARPPHQPPPPPHQRHRPTRHLQIAHLVVAAAMHPPARRRAARPLRTQHCRDDPHRQPLGQVDQHPQHPHLRQPQPHRHNISRHRGPPGLGACKHRTQQGLDPYPRTLNPPSSQKIAKSRQVGVESVNPRLMCGGLV